jgi:DNA-binding NarL/FixJ family response regulator
LAARSDTFETIAAMVEHRIIIVDDHPLFRDALSQTLSAGRSRLDIAQASSLDGLAALLDADKSADLILLDLNMPGIHGYSGLLFLRAQYPEIPVVIVSANEDVVTIRRCLDLGASGFIPKSQSADGIRAALKAVLEGGVWTPPELDLSGEDDDSREVTARLSTLTPQQMRVLMMLGEGMLNKQIAFKLNVSEATVKAHVSAILQKLGVDSRTQAVIAVNRIEAGDWQKLGE